MLTAAIAAMVCWCALKNSSIILLVGLHVLASVVSAAPSRRRVKRGVSWCACLLLVAFQFCDGSVDRRHQLIVHFASGCVVPRGQGNMVLCDLKGTLFLCSLC
jgi:hypothetical protein